MRALRLHLPVHAGSPREARRQLREWLAGRHWPPAEASDIVLAVDEAVTNAVEHAYAEAAEADQPDNRGVELCGTDVYCADHTRRVLITVTDRGRWQPPSAAPGHRGRGLKLMRFLSDSVELTTGAAGTSVQIVSRAVKLTTSGAAHAARRLRGTGALMLLAGLAPRFC